MYDRGMIDQKQIGIYTKKRIQDSSEENHKESTIRFGSYDDDLIDKGHELLWMNTTESNSWAVKVNRASFGSSKEIWSDTEALMDPGYPFIGIPPQHYKAFQEQIKNAYSDDMVDCSSNAWCYFKKPCNELYTELPDLKFTFTVNHALGSVNFSVPPKSYLYETESINSPEICHMGIVSLSQSSFPSSQIILGQSFMENHYITLDSTN